MSIIADILAVKKFLDKESPRIDKREPEELDPKHHYIEYEIYLERERLHDTVENKLEIFSNIHKFFNHPTFQGDYAFNGTHLISPERAILEVVEVLDVLFGNGLDIYREIQNYYNSLPYHNLNHAVLVAYTAIDLYYEINKDKDNINDTELRKLVIASLMHDARHSGGFFTDEQNIQHALMAFQSLNYKLNLFENSDDIVAMICCTEFTDGKFPIEAVTDLEMILRDADLLSSIYSSNLADQLLNLAKERNIVFDHDVDLVINQIKFMDGISLYFEVSAARYRMYRDKVVKVLDCDEIT